MAVLTVDGFPGSVNASPQRRERGDPNEDASIGRAWSDPVCSTRTPADQRSDVATFLRVRSSRRTSSSISSLVIVKAGATSK